MFKRKINLNKGSATFYYKDDIFEKSSRFVVGEHEQQRHFSFQLSILVLDKTSGSSI